MGARGVGGEGGRSIQAYRGACQHFVTQQERDPIGPAGNNKLHRSETSIYCLLSLVRNTILPTSISIEHNL